MLLLMVPNPYQSLHTLQHKYLSIVLMVDLIPLHHSLYKLVLLLFAYEFQYQYSVKHSAPSVYYINTYIPYNPLFDEKEG